VKCFTITLSIFLLATNLFATIINIPDDFETIQAGIDEAEDGDTVLVAPGEYVENINFESKAISVIGDPDDPSEVVIDGEENGSVVTIEDVNADAKLMGFTITDGEAENGSGIMCISSDIQLSYLKIERNHSETFGGGIYIDEHSSPTIEHVELISNRAAYGAGICIEDGDENMPTLSYVTFALNYSVEEDGSAIYNGAEELNIVNCTFARNGHGTIYVSQGEISVVNCIFSRNGEHEIIVSDDGSAFIDFCDVQRGRNSILGENVDYGEDNISEDPHFYNVEERDLRIRWFSPCVDAGDPDSPDDPDGTRADMGAFYSHQYEPDDDGVLHVPDEYETIQEAIDTPEDGDTVLVDPGEYVENINFASKAIAVIGNPDDPGEVVIDGNRDGSVVVFEYEEDENSVLAGLTITNGSNGFGGGIRIEGSSPTLKFLIVSNNRASSGGGIGSSEGDLLVHNSTIRENRAGCGGGIRCYRGTMVVTDVILTENRSECSGAIEYSEVEATLTNVEVSNNYGATGALYSMFNCESIFTNITVVGNRGVRGVGGLLLGLGSNATIINSIFWDNESHEIYYHGDDNLEISYSNLDGGRDAVVGRGGPNVD